MIDQQQQQQQQPFHLNVSNVDIDTYGWVTGKDDNKYYSVIKELPTEIKFQISSILFQSTHNIPDIIDLIVPNRLERTLSDVTRASPMCRLLKYLETAPPDYFKLVLSTSEIQNSEVASRCVKLATEISIESYYHQDLVTFFNDDGYFSKVAKEISGSLETFTSIKSFMFSFANTERQYLSQTLRWLIYIIKRLPSLRRITLTYFSMDEEPTMNTELVECFSISKATAYLAVLWKRFFDYSFPFSYIRTLNIIDRKFEECHSLEKALGKCISLQQLTIPSVVLWAPELDHCIDALNKLQNSKVVKLEIWNLDFLSSTDDRVLNLKIPVSVRCLEFRRPVLPCSEPMTEADFQIKPYSVILPPIIEDLRVVNFPIFISNFKDVTWLEDAYFHLGDFKRLAVTVRLLSMYTRKMEKVEFYVKDFQAYNSILEVVDFQHSPKMEHCVLNFYAFLEYLIDIPSSVTELFFTLVIGRLSLHFNFTSSFWRYGDSRKEFFTSYLLRAQKWSKKEVNIN
ncbi:unnamed protein product [Ambrosiozyma monospora]|uniref:Unnamed protein product n=1 Tax=Ambrosiozyma monospora TaxID=43982 RepID=A0ACB5SV62_AMBMO|nr:unnamed protein product [Ambrosiozyma monospora]